MLISDWLGHRFKQTAAYIIVVTLTTVAVMAHPTQAQSAQPMYTVSPGGLSQFPVRSGPATDDYVSLEQMCGIGRTLPAYNLIDVKGRRFALTSVRGKIVVLDFWGTTCGPCLRAMPHLGKLASEYHAQNVVFLSVCESVNDEAGFRRIAAQYHATDLRFLMDPSAQQGQKSLRDLLHNGMGQPVQLIINQEGRVVGALQSYDDTNDPNMTMLRQSIETTLHSIQHG